MTLVGIRHALVAQLEAGWTHDSIQIFYENVETIDLASLTSDYFLKCAIEFENAEQANISTTPFHRTYGTLTIDVYARGSTGKVGALGYADELSSSLGFKTLGGVHLQAPRVKTGRAVAGWHLETLRVSFFADSNT